MMGRMANSVLVWALSKHNEPTRRQERQGERWKAKENRKESGIEKRTRRDNERKRHSKGERGKRSIKV